MEGEVIQTHYNPGKYFNAKGPKASLLNEQNAVVLKTKQGVEMMFVQIAGFIARRIVSYAKPGVQLTQGQRMGIIRFGSRVDVYVPPNSLVTVAMDQKVSAGQTILGEIVTENTQS